MTEYYNIAGVTLSLAGDDLPARGPLEPFACGKTENPDVRVKVVSKPAGAATEYDYSDRGASWAKLGGGGWYYSYLHDDGAIVSDALISGDWSDIVVYANPGAGYREIFLKPTLETLFYNICLLHKGIALHSAAVEWEGRGIVFSAPSGTGKSTQADLWVNNYGAEYINGDRPVLKSDGGRLFVCGTAWSGSAGIYRNARVPLAAVFFIEQHPENLIEPLSAAGALKLILPRCFLPYQDRAMMALAMDNIEDIVSRAACWLLKCTPDLRAAELARECITKRNFLEKE